MIDYSQNQITGLNTLMAVLSLGKFDEDCNSFMWSSINEYPILFSLVSIYRPANVIELGTCNGASALTFAVAMKLSGIPGEVHTWDMKARFQIDAGSGYEASIKRYIATSAECGSIIKDIGGKKLVFIDADHTYEGCLADIEAVKPYLKKGDVVVFHDYFHGPVADAVATAIKDIVLTDNYVIPSRQQIKVLVW